MGMMIPSRKLEVNKFVFEETQFIAVESCWSQQVRKVKFEKMKLLFSLLTGSGAETRGRWGDISPPNNLAVSPL